MKRWLERFGLKAVQLQQGSVRRVSLGQAIV